MVEEDDITPDTRLTLDDDNVANKGRWWVALMALVAAIQIIATCQNETYYQILNVIAVLTCFLPQSHNMNLILYFQSLLWSLHSNMSSLMYTCTKSSLTYPNLELEAVLTFIYIITNTCHSNGVFRSGSDHAFSKPGHFSHKVNTQ